MPIGFTWFQGEEKKKGAARLLWGSGLGIKCGEDDGDEKNYLTFGDRIGHHTLPFTSILLPYHL
jgi:hypothetical protein